MKENKTAADIKEKAVSETKISMMQVKFITCYGKKLSRPSLNIEPLKKVASEVAKMDFIRRK